MSTCNCDGTISQSASDYGASLLSLSDLFGGLAPDTKDTIACQNAVARTKALGLDPCDEYSVDVLANLFAEEQGNVASVAATVPFSNPLQKAVDVSAGTGTPETPVVPSKPSTPQPSGLGKYGLLIGFAAILAIGFLLIFR